MSNKRVLMACPNYWNSPFQVGSHHLAREFVRAGWQVAYLSDPITPLHFAGRWSPELKARLKLWWQGGRSDHDGRLWTYVPAALAVGHNKPLLRGEAIHRHWQHWTAPNVIRRVEAHGFGSVDLLYIDSISQSFWLDAIQYKQAVYRLTDYSPNHARFTAAASRLEQEMARRADLVAYPSNELHSYVTALGARRSLYLPNGVDYQHFTTPQAPPPEYANLSKPIAVYVGKIVSWFHFDWVRQAARALPEMSFMLIGQPELARRELAGLANVHVLGFRDYATLPGYLQHADVGIIPFNAGKEADTVDCLNPCKMYQYFAAGLPVVASGWQALRRMDTPAHSCDSAADFIAALRQAVATNRAAEAYRRFAARFNWGASLQNLLRELDAVTNGNQTEDLPVAA